MIRILMVAALLSASGLCAQPIIQGDPTEPRGPIRPDYWVGRKTNPFPRGEGAGVRSETKATLSPKATLTDSYTFYSNVRVNDDPPGMGFATPYSSGGHAMAARGDTVYLVWRDDRSGTSTIYFDKSNDGGNTWGTDVAISDNPAAAAVMPALAVGKDGAIYVSWTDFRDGNRHIYFAKSANGGASFGTNVRVCNEHEEYQAFSSIAVNDSGRIFIAWEDGRNSATQKLDVYCARSDDGGASFLSSIRVDDTGTDSSGQGGGGIAVKDSCVYIVFADYRDENYSYMNVYFAKSTNNGQTYNNNILVNDTVGQINRSQWAPSIAVDDSDLIYIAWRDNRVGIYHTYYTKSNDGGLSFTTPNLNLIDAAGQPYAQVYPSLCCDDSGGVYCAWEDTRNYINSARQIYMGFSKNYGDSFSMNYHVDDRPEEDSAWLFDPTLCVNKAGRVFCAWADNRVNGAGLTMDIYATTGSYVGVEGYPPNENPLIDKVKYIHILTPFPAR